MAVHFLNAKLLLQQLPVLRNDYSKMFSTHFTPWAFLPIINLKVPNLSFVIQYVQHQMWRWSTVSLDENVQISFSQVFHKVYEGLSRKTIFIAQISYKSRHIADILVVALALTLRM